jgi:hypothetical protein
MVTRFEVIKKNNKPFVRMVSGNYQVDMMVYGAKTEAPYVKYMSGYMGKTYLTEDMKADLRNIMNR